MKITVKLIATYRQHLPEGTVGNSCILDVPEGHTVKDVLEKFDIPMDKSTVVLVNGHVPEYERVLLEDDVVAAFSAIAGG